MKIADLEARCEHCRKGLRSKAASVPVYLRTDGRGEVYQASVHASCLDQFSATDLDKIPAWREEAERGV